MARHAAKAGPAPGRVLLIRSNPVAPDPRVERAARTLSKAGFAVRVLAWDRGSAGPRQEGLQGFEVERLLIPGGYGRGLRNLPSLLRWQASLLRLLLAWRHEYALLHACDLDTALPALLVGRSLGKGMVFDLFDSYPDMLRTASRLLRRLLRGLQDWAATAADAVILPDEARLEQLKRAKPKKVVIIYNSPEDSYQELARLAQQEEGFKVAYVGVLEPGRGLSELLEVMSRHPEWKLDLAGFGSAERAICSRASSMPNVRFHGRVAHKAALALMARATALVAMYDPAVPNHRFASPNKLFEAMMLAKPIVVAERTHADALVRRHGCGLVVPYGDWDALEAALATLASEPALCRQLGSAGRAAYEALYNWELMASRLLALYAELGAAQER